jgi:enoyl-CoA hydratase
VITFEERGHVGIVTIDRQERRNALNAELCDQLRSHLEASSALRAVVITGAGTAFCAGADLVSRFAAHGDATTDTFRPAFEEVLDAIVAHPAPVLAAINGPAIGAGMQLAVACDVRIAALGARLDDVIDPADTRAAIARGLRITADKQVDRPWRKHGVLPV